jgi:hypothetical protein
MGLKRTLILELTKSREDEGRLNARIGELNRGNMIGIFLIIAAADFMEREKELTNRKIQKHVSDNRWMNWKNVLRN